MKKIFFLLSFLFISQNVFADEYSFLKVEKSFKNFLRCELKRDNAENHFNAKPFTIGMIDLFDIQKEADITIITGAVKCIVEHKHINLYVALGVKEIMGKSQVLYYQVEKRDFNTQATTLLKYPYKERCQWSQYWIDIN